jgi:hypothetical protein
MSERSWRNIALVLAVVFVILSAAAVGTLIGGGSPAPTVGPGSSNVAVGSASPSAPAASGSISPSAVPSATTSGSPGPSASATASPSPTLAPAPPTTVTLTQLKLDARQVHGGTARFIAFTSDGPGTITAKLTSDTPQGTTHMVLRVGNTDIQTKDWAAGTLTAHTTPAHAAWRITLEGNGMDTPTVELTITYPSRKPSLTITHATFDGTASNGYNGVQVRFAPRSAGNATLTAKWGGHAFVYEVDLLNETGGSGSQTLANQGPATNTANTFPVTSPDTWKLVLQNVETGIGRTDMTVTISWP